MKDHVAKVIAENILARVSEGLSLVLMRFTSYWKKDEKSTDVLYKCVVTSNG